MARTLLFTALLLIGFGSQAQSWCPPGATWTYHWDGWGAEYREEYRYANDTTLGGRVAQKCIVSVQGTTLGGSPISSTYSEYTSNDGGIVWAWGSWYGGPAAWDTLYWFGAQVGDHWFPPGHPETCPPHGMLEITALGTTVIDGITLQSLTLVTIDQDGNPITNPEQLIQRIGMMPRYPFVFDCNSVIDYYFPHFVCYSDEDIHDPTGSVDCHLTMGIGDLGQTRTGYSMHPNPGTDHLTVQLPAGSHRITLLDATGRSLLEQHTTEQQPVVNTSGLSPGIYLLRMDNGPGIRWVKE